MEQTLKKALEKLQEGGVIVYPTDTVWGIGGDATKVDVVSKIFKIKQRTFSKSLVVLVRDWNMLQSYVGQIPNAVRKILADNQIPTTIIYEDPNSIAENAIADDGSIAIRIPNHDFCQALLKKFDKPIISTSANMSGNPTPRCFKEIDLSILEAADYVVNLEREKRTEKSSRILKINKQGEVEIIRP